MGSLIEDREGTVGRLGAGWARPAVRNPKRRLASATGKMALSAKPFEFVRGQIGQSLGRHSVPGLAMETPVPPQNVMRRRLWSSLA